jgi:GT2 family glycosyltransferase
MTTDGRTDLLAQAIDSAIENLPPFTPWILVDDSGSEAAEEFYPRFARVVSHFERRGLAASVNDGWGVAATDGVDYLFHLEDDFTFNGPPDIEGMAALLDADPDLAQVSLKRQPVNGEEIAAGGFIEANSDAYRETTPLLPGAPVWTEHREFYTLNSHLSPRWVFEQGWPAGNEAEQTARLNEDPDNRFAIWGAKFDPPAVTHLGTSRMAGWLA